MNFVLFASVILFCGLFNTQPKNLRIPLEFSDGYPTMKVEIEGKTHSLILDLGTYCEFALKREVLDAIPTKELEFIAFHTTISLNGQDKISPCYLFQRIRIQNSEIIHTLVDEDNDPIPKDISGRIGKKVLQTCNVLIDFPHSLFFIVKNFEDLRAEGYSIKDFQEIPCDVTRWGAVFTIETDFGIKHFVIDTSSPCSAIRISQEESQKDKITTSKFKLGECDLGNTELDGVDIDPIFDDIDGYLGIDFFKKNIVFIDFPNKKALLRPYIKNF